MNAQERLENTVALKIMLDGTDVKGNIERLLRTLPKTVFGEDAVVNLETLEQVTAETIREIFGELSPKLVEIGGYLANFSLTADKKKLIIWGNSGLT